MDLFDDLGNQVSQQSLGYAKMEIISFQREYHKLCEVVELADEMFSPFIIGIMSLQIPWICFNSCLVVNLLQENAENKILIIGNNLFRLTVVACFVTILLLIDDNGDSDNGKDITI